jgi:type VI secretion system secreted protein Hcp
MRTRKQKKKLVVSLLGVAGLGVFSLFAVGGNLEPNAPPGPTMHTLDEIYEVCSSLVEPAGYVPEGPVPDAGFVKFEGIDGPSTDPQHLNWCDLLCFSEGFSASETSIYIQDISFTKVTDKATPKLMEALCTRQNFPKVEVHLTTSFEGVGRVTYYKYELKNAVPTSMAGGGTPGEGPLTENITLSWDELKVIYTEYDASGNPLGDVEYTVVNPNSM